MMGSRREAHAALAAAGMRPRKRFGQHFLCDEAVVRRIVETAAVGPDAAVLEIGPGLGALTDTLAARAQRLYLVEVDRDLVARLRERYADRPHVAIIEADVLDVRLDRVIPDPPVTVVANLPYNIGTEVVFRLLEVRRHFPHAVLMLQREVAERFTARPGTDAWGAPSVMLQTFADVRVAFGVSRRSFHPPPRVTSAVIDIRWLDSPRVEIGSLAAYRAVVRAAFGQRRKTLRNALGRVEAEWSLAPGTAAQACVAAGIDPGARAETLDVAAFGSLTRALLEQRDA
jgi:16S rRNA (adenine1518-N6/adenine1519-N6)-dimethyltransferase